MIPKFRTYLKESVWGDLRKKSLGQEERIEDDVNLLDIEEFYDYLDEHYDNKVDHLELNLISTPNIGVGITQDILLFFKPERGHILLSWSRVKIKMPFFDELSDRFNVENPNVMRRIITAKDKSCTNKTFIDVIDFFIEHKDDLLVNESVWGDLRKKSLGQEDRIETDINSMDYEELGNYILENYNLEDEDGLFWSDTKGNASGIGIFIIRLDYIDNLLEYFTAVDDDDDSKRVTVYPNIEKLDPNLYNNLKETYKLYDTEDRVGMMSLLGIDPKDGRNIDNKFFIEVLNFIIDNLDPKYKKKIDKK